MFETGETEGGCIGRCVLFVVLAAMSAFAMIDPVPAFESVLFRVLCGFAVVAHLLLAGLNAVEFRDIRRLRAETRKRLGIDKAVAGAMGRAVLAEAARRRAEGQQ